MPIGEPTGPHRYDYRLTFRDALSPQTDAEKKTYFTVTVDRTSAPHEDTLAAFQRLMDLIDASPDFDQPNARRTGEITETITPTDTGGV